MRKIEKKDKNERLVSLRSFCEGFCEAVGLENKEKQLADNNEIRSRTSRKRRKY
jgi:hypothetical protein